MKKTDEQKAAENAFERAVRAAKNALDGKPPTLDANEQRMLAGFPKEDHLAVIVFVRWCEGQSWKDGIKAKLAAKAAFIEAGRIFKAIYAPAEDQEKAPLSGAQ